MASWHEPPRIPESSLAAKIDRLRQMEEHYRRRGWGDGYAGKPVASHDANYQAAWRRGLEARESAHDEEAT